MSAGIAGIIAAGKSIVRDSSLINWVEAGLIQSYPGSGATWTDLSSNAKNVSLVATPTFTNNYLTFAAASSQYCNYASSLVASTMTAFTVCMWVYPTAAGQLLSVLGQTAINTLYHYCMFDVSAGGVFGYGLYNTTTGNIKMSSTAQSLNTWHHLALTFTGTTWVSYLNGAVVNTSTTASWSPPSNVMYFGLMAIDTTLLNVAASYGSGRVGHFSVYNSALTAAGVGQNYAAGLGMYA